MVRRALFLVLLSGLSACGGRTSLDYRPPPDAGPPFDGGRDAGFDGGLDAGPPDAGTLLVDCGRSEQYTSPRRPLEVQATTDSPAPLTSAFWTLEDIAPGSMPEFETGPAPELATLTPDIVGEYLLRFSAMDAMGRRAECTVTVHAVVGPPVALCPEDMLRTQVDVPLMVVGSGFDDEAVVSFDWQILSGPDGAQVELDPPDSPVVTFVADTLGVYRLKLTVADADMATDSCELDVEVTGPPLVVCPPDTEVPTRQSVTVTAMARDDVGIASRRWELVTQPTGSTATLRPTDRDATNLTPDRQGDYLLRFTVTDFEGLTASCTTRVRGLPSPPDVTCPAVIETTPLTPTSITATAVDDGTITSWSWSVTDRPAGSAAPNPTPRTAATTTFTPDIAGVYRLSLTVRDNDGMTDMCVTEVRAANIEGLRIEMSWDTNGTDMDTHLMNPTGTRWGSGNDDCYFGNCVSSGGSPILSWGAAGPDDDPRLDIDDTNGFGPENINIAAPQPGTYRVAIHDWRGDGRTNNVTVRIYCGGSTTEPRQTFGPVGLRDRGAGGNDFWRVADVTITTTGCTITDLTRPDGRAWVEPYDRTRNMR